MRLLVGEAQFFFTRMSETQLQPCSKGGKICFRRGQNFWVGLVFTKFSVDIQKKKGKVIAPIGLLFSEVSVGFPKKCHHLETAARARKVRVGMQGILERDFCLGGAPPFACLLAALTHVCKKII